MSKPNTLEICRVHLFYDKDELTKNGIPDMLMQRILRMRSAYMLWLEHPRKKDAELRDLLLKFGINKSAAYEDIQIVKLLLGDMTETSKAFHRFKFNSMIQNAYDVAEQKHDTRSMVAASAGVSDLHPVQKGRHPERRLLQQHARIRPLLHGQRQRIFGQPRIQIRQDSG